MFQQAVFYIKFSLSILWLAQPIYAGAGYFNTAVSYEVYFTPTDNCTAHIVNTIHKAKRSIYVQAYFLTSEPIISALIEAKARDIAISVILDKNHPENQKGIKKMLAMDISIWIDQLSGIAHNKVMILDEATVITGSFNFTHSANHRNRENVLVIHDHSFAQHYLDNWHRCQLRSKQETILLKKASKPLANKYLSEFEKVLIALFDWIDSILKALNVVMKRI